jgi:hypothetical protein
LRETWNKEGKHLLVKELMHILDHDNHDMRKNLRQSMVEDDIFLPRYNMVSISTCLRVSLIM